MKIFWYCNGIMPPLARHLKQSVPNWGGWTYACAQRLTKSGIQLAIANAYMGQDVQKIILDGITYYQIPYRSIESFAPRSLLSWRQALDDFAPDLIHLYGTEYPVAHSLLAANSSIPAIVSIQGLVSVCSRYYTAGLTTAEVIRSVALRDLIRPSKTWLPFAAKDMQKRGEWEKKTISQVRHVIGRTAWDRAHCLAINPNVQYHFCNETLREPFYTAKKWQYESCAKHTIFASNPSYPLKGIHQLLKALTLVIRRFPDAKLKIAGNDVMHLNSAKDFLRLPGYSLYLRRLIKKLKLQEHVVFLGSLSAEQMIAEFQTTHCFVLPSAIENSSNTLGEAQLLGVPSIASYVGGDPDMIRDGVDGFLYHFDDVEMLAQKIIDLWLMEANIGTVSQNAIQTAKVRHSPPSNVEQLIRIYQEVIDSSQMVK